MKNFSSINEFINHAPQCLFCGLPVNIYIASNFLKMSKTPILSMKVSGQPLFREKQVNVFRYCNKYHYFSRIDNDKMIISCTEKYSLSGNPNQTYDALSIDLNNSIVELDPKIDIGILNSFARINFKFCCTCTTNGCLGHMYSSSGIIAGAKSKKIMPFFLREENMTMKESLDDGIIYTLRSDYYGQTSQLERSNAPSDYSNSFVGLLSSDPAVTLPLIDLTLIKTKQGFLDRVENYVTFL